MADNEKYVTFLDADGNEISNDPRWHAEKVLQASGVNVEAMQAKIAELQAKVDAANNTDITDDGDDESEDDLAKLKGPELKALAKERGVDISGMTKVSEVREALRTAQA